MVRPVPVMWSAEEDAALVELARSGERRAQVARAFLRVSDEKKWPPRTVAAVITRMAMKMPDPVPNPEPPYLLDVGMPPPPATEVEAPEEEAGTDDGWVKVQTPKKWMPKKPKEALIGTYVGPHAATGAYGPYVKHLILVEGGNGDVRYVSGTVADQLFAVSLAKPGDMVRVLYLGSKEAANGAYNDYDLYVRRPKP